MMRVEMKNGKIVCTASDWKALKENERKFLSDCYWGVIWTGFNEEGDLAFFTDSNEASKERRIYTMKNYADRNNIVVDERIEEYLLKVKAQAREEHERELAAKNAQLKLEQWEYRKKIGCDGCSYSYQVGDAWFRCRFSGDELDCRFMEKYNPALQAMEIFHEVGVPNEHCKDYVKEEIKHLEEIKNDKV